MDFLQKATDQLRDLFQSMTPGARITAGLLLAAVVVSLVYLFQFGFSGGTDYLLGGQVFSSTEMGRMTRALAEAGYHVETEGNRVIVPRGKEELYIAALAEHNGLPKDLSRIIPDVLTGASALESQHTREARLNNAKQEYLSEVVSRMTGIETATVTYDEQDLGGFPRRKQASAMVAVWPDSRLEDRQVRTIRDLVAASFALLNHADITVIDQESGESHVGKTPDGSYLPEDDPYRKLKKSYESDWQEKITNYLTKSIPGVLVSVNVELNPELSQEEYTQKLDNTPVSIRTVETSREATTRNQPAGGQPGAVPNGVGSNQPAQVNSGGVRESTETETTGDSQKIVGTTQTRTKKASLVPSRVAVSIDVPESTFARIWQQQNPDAPNPPTAADLKRIEDDQIKKVEEAVAQLLPPRPPGDDVYRPIMVTTYQDLPSTAPPEIGFVVPIFNWLSMNWQSIGAFGLGIVCLVMLRGMTKGANEPAVGGSNARSDAMSAIAAQNHDDDEEDEEEMIRRFADGLKPKGPNLRAELASMVQQDPEAAVHVLQNWIGDVA